MTNFRVPEITKHWPALRRAMQRSRSRRIWRASTSLGAFVLRTVIPLWALYISIQSYRHAVKSGNEQAVANQKQQNDQAIVNQKQQAALDGSRTALETAVSLAKDQAALLNGQNEQLAKSYDVLQKQADAVQSQLTIVGEQWKRELARQAQRPKITITLAKIEPAPVLFDNPAGPYAIRLSAQRTIKLSFLIMNVGDAPVTHPSYVTGASKNDVSVEPKTAGGINAVDVLPVSRTGSGYGAERTVTVPVDVEQFDIRFSMFGDNLDVTSAVFSFRIVP